MQQSFFKYLKFVENCVEGRNPNVEEDYPVETRVAIQRLIAYERVLNVRVDNMIVAACSFSELMGENAAYEILEKSLKNLRAYGVITNKIEGRLSDVIEEALASEDLRHYREIGIGAIK